ncbi:FAD/NAD(P)-binding domain-containing protein [Exidia glandulosa HHB12029]|uniref:FAD/NAD(P)-binding domain-containing protein n=1 Tax=Exidia glandulosa HHB12029 TaxID=1314781 RepID=A0A165IFV0_EXIGL|nr:FAD/NAD(P)-binding domain-containing protein [Exidia glandulosa HHB12029]
MAATWSPGTAAPDPAIQQKYVEERNKRIRAEGSAQFVDLNKSDQKILSEDPWADHAALNAAEPVLKDGDSVKFLVLGAGYGGLLFAVRLIQEGLSASDIRIIDDGAGFGGTWYWNRYPGLMCDVESYIYMPLLEETGYVPKHKYAYGPELREHAERIAKQWDLSDKAMWRTQAHAATWNDDTKRWSVAMKEGRGPGQQSRDLHLDAQFVFCASGLLNVPHIPKLPGLENFEGKYFHTARWDYSISGGSPTDPSLELLKGKRVGIIGTGATAVQVIPQLAKWAEHLYVFQRTPSAVDVRGQQETNMDTWKTEVATGKGWQRARTDNFNSWITDMASPNDPNLVNDGWTHIKAYKAIIGGKGRLGNMIPPEKIPEHVAALHEDDFERAQSLRARVDAIVKDKETAEKLKPWYPSWCKRPTFHDDYLPAFNQPNVTLVDTDGKGCSGMTPRGIIDAHTGKEYEIDVLVFSTGYRSPGGGSGSPAWRASMTISGRGGRSMDEKFVTEGAATLHGIASNGYPNLFFPGPLQATASANFMFVIDCLAQLSTYVAAEGLRKAADPTKVALEPSKEAEEAWSMQCLMRAGFYAGISGCTPSYMTNEGDRDKVVDMQEQMKAGRAAPWSEGIASFLKLVGEWKAEGKLSGYVGF